MATRNSVPKRRLYAAAAVSLALVTAACAAPAASTAPTSSASASAAAASAAPSSSSSAAAATCNQTEQTPGVTATTITLGNTVPLTGSAATSGKGELAGMKAYFDSVNAHGGVQGRQINFIALDDQYQPAVAQQQARLLVQQNNIFAWVGGYGTPPFLAVEPFLMSENVPAIAPSAESDTLGTMSTPNMYATFVNYITQYEIETKYIIDKYQPKSYALVGVAGNTGNAALKGMQLAVGSGVTIKYIPETPGNPNLTPIATTLKEANADWVFIILTAADSGQLLGAMQRIGYTPHLAGNQINADSSFIQPFKDVANGMVVSVLTADLGSSAPAVQQFVRDFQAATGQAPTTNNELGWAQAEVAVQALKTAPALTRSCLYSALNQMTGFQTGLIPPITFGPTNRQGVDAIGLEQIENGGLVPLLSTFVSLKGSE